MPARGVTRPMRSQGARARLPLFPRPRSAAAGARPGLGRRRCAPNCRNCPTPRRRASSRDYGLAADDAERAGRRAGDRRLFRDAWREGRDPKLAANWVMGDLFARAEPARGSASSSRRSSAEQLGELIDLIADGTISGRIAKDVFADDGRDRRAPGRDRRRSGPAPGHRHRRDRGRGRRGARRASPTRSRNTAPARTSSSASSSAR